MDVSPLTLYRAAMGLSQEDLRVQLGISSTGTISKWEKGRIPAERVLEVSRLTGIPPHRLRPDIYPAPPERAAS
jgi:transcriptional regulator with XRE-family HTH domain